MSKIPENIQIVIDEYKKIKGDIDKPKKVYLKDKNDFDSIKHENILIEFTSGGKVGDDLWQLQYTHNSSVLLKYDQKIKSIKDPNYAPETCIIIEDPSKVKSICEYFKDIIINEIPMNHLYIANQLYDLRPIPEYMVRDDMFFIKFIDKTKRKIKYIDGKIEDIEVHECKY